MPPDDRKAVDRADFEEHLASVVDRYGVWMALHWFTEAMREPCRIEAKKNDPPKQPRRKQA
jgi:hypothetical protein